MFDFFLNVKVYSPRRAPAQIVAHSLPRVAAQRWPQLGNFPHRPPKALHQTPIRHTPNAPTHAFPHLERARARLATAG